VINFKGANVVILIKKKRATKKFVEFDKTKMAVCRIIGSKNQKILSYVEI
jgi:hypothetical protein